MPTLMDRNPGGSGWALAVLLRARSCNHSTRDSASASDSSSSDESSRRALTQATDEQNDDGVCSRRTTSVSTSRVEQIRLRFVAIYGRRHCHDPPASIFRRYQQASNFFAASFAHGKPPLSTPPTAPHECFHSPDRRKTALCCAAGAIAPSSTCLGRAILPLGPWRILDCNVLCKGPSNSVCPFPRQHGPLRPARHATRAPASPHPTTRIDAFSLPSLCLTTAWTRRILQS